MISIKSKQEIDKMREACRIVALAHEEVEKALITYILETQMTLQILEYLEDAVH